MRDGTRACALRGAKLVSIPSRFIFAFVAGPTAWNFSIGNVYTKASPFSGNSEGAVELAMIRSKLGEELVVGDACEDCELGWRFHTPTAQLTSW